MAGTGLNTLALGRTAPSTWVKRAGIAVAGSLFLALCSHITLPLPWTLVPLNLQPFGVILLGLLLGPTTAAVAAVLYLLEGASGMPVFSPTGLGGIAQLTGPTGGYLMCYPFAAWVAGRLASRSFFATLGAAVAADALVLMAGTAWLTALLHLSPRAGFLMGAAPFLPGDFLKCVAAAGLATGYAVWKIKHRERSA